MSLAKRLACEILLHHVLIESLHHDNDENAAKELFPEILCRFRVVEHEEAAHTTVLNGMKGLGQIHP